MSQKVFKNICFFALLINFFLKVHLNKNHFPVNLVHQHYRKMIPMPLNKEITFKS
jgi:hypothetical protein